MIRCDETPKGAEFNRPCLRPGPWTRAIVLLGLVGLLVAAPCAWGQAAQRPEAPDSSAIRTAAAEVALRPDDPDAHNRLGSAYYAIGAFDRAVAAFRRAVVLDPRDVAGLVNIGVVLNEQGNAAEALEHFRRALAVDPQDVIATANEGIAHYALGDTAAAVVSWMRALDSDPGSVLAHFYLGIAFADAGIVAEAIREWEAVIAAESEGAAAAQARMNIARIRERAPSEN
ncbi:MAG: tetratricopeptide repeat protein [Candidatus Eisenbacteria sp.]|nr:tetratricopeptide repeat protein [Candidatus Eisenbacteria bacterium]